MKSLLCIAFALMISVPIHAQQKTVSGTVTSFSDGSPLPGATVMIKGTTTGAQTDFEGGYAINVKVGQILQFSYVGYQNYESKIRDSTTVIDVVLKEDSASLEEVVVVGHGFTGKHRGLSDTGYFTESPTRREATTTRSDEPQSGQLTAAEINDLENWDAWLKALESEDFKSVKEDWKFLLTKKVKVVVKNSKNRPLNNLPVFLYDSRDRLIMKGRTNVQGEVILFKDFETPSNTQMYRVRIVENGQAISRTIKNTADQAIFILDEPNESSHRVDIMFTIDATGSMGDEIDYLKSELKNIITWLDKRIEEKRVALTFYRDHGDAYLVRDFDFNTNIDDVKAFLSEQDADGGGDYEEAVEEALKVSMAQSWQLDSKAKLLFLLLDAPPHFIKQNVSTIKEQIKRAQEKGIRIIPIVASGADKNVEFLMRYFSIATNGTYVFLTDDSGIGNPHLKPTTDAYKVEKLNDLIVRLIERYAGIAH